MIRNHRQLNGEETFFVQATASIVSNFSVSATDIHDAKRKARRILKRDILDSDPNDILNDLNENITVEAAKV